MKSPSLLSFAAALISRTRIGSRRKTAALALWGALGLGLVAAPSAVAQSYLPNTLYSFGGSPANGVTPQAGLLIDSSGNLYGTTYSGGANGYGTVFELVNSSGTYTEKVLYSFAASIDPNTGFLVGDGAHPQAGLIMDSSGNLYGTTYQGGAIGAGTVFELVNSSGSYSENVLYNFAPTVSGICVIGCAFVYIGDGAFPQAGLIMDSSGNLYGTTYTGGANGYGTVFGLFKSSAGTYGEKVLYSFTSANGDGAYPQAGLIMDSSGNLYGTTYQGGKSSTTFASGAGTVFELVNSSGTYTEKVLYSFTGPTGDGANPEASLIMDSSGNLYGTTKYGGAGCTNILGCGVVFELVNSSGTYGEKVLYSFAPTVSNSTLSGDGGIPQAGLVMDASGNLYGTTSRGGANDYGTVFDLVNSSGTYSESLLYSFTTCSNDGQRPSAGLVMDSSGNLYGTTTKGGTYGAGTVLALTNFSGRAAAPTTTTLISSKNPAFAGDPVTLTATVTSSSGVVTTGTLSFSNGGVPLATQPAACGTASISFEDAAAIGIGNSIITAQYAPGTPPFAASTGTLNQTIIEAGAAVTNGSNTFAGNQTVNGTLNATSFVGNGSGLSNVTASALACIGCVGNPQLGINYAGSATQGGPATNALMLGGLLPNAFQLAGAYATTGSNLFSGDQNIAGNVTATGNLTVASGNFTGSLSAAGAVLPPAGAATASQAFNSNTLDTAASVFNSTAGAAQSHLFRWQAEPVAGSNNTASPSATLNLSFGSNGAPSETGLSINPNGTINFASGQTFPGAAGTGTITGVTAGTGLAGGGLTGNITLNNAGILSLTAGSGLSSTGGQTPTLSLNTSVTDSRYLLLTGGTLTGNLMAPSFAGNGSALTSLNPANLAAGTAGINITGNAATATVAGTAATATNASNAANALNLGGLPPSAYQPAGSYATTGPNTFSGSQTISGNLTASGSLSGALGSFTGTISTGGTSLMATGTATTSQGFLSSPLDLFASSFNTSSGAVNQQFRWQAEPAANNTPNPSGTLNFLYASGGGLPSETGLSIDSLGHINFAPGQTFPGTGSGTITGVAAGTGLTGGGNAGNVTLTNAGVLSLAAGNGLSSTGGQTPTLSLNTSFTDGRYVALSGGTLTGGLTAPSFAGNGSALTSLNPANLAAGTAGINITGNAATATVAGTAATATNASNAANAANLGGVSAGNYARLDIANSFAGSQSVTGNMSVSGNSATTGTVTLGSGGTPIKEHLSMTFNPAFPALKPGACATASFRFTGASDGDTTALGVPSTRMTGGGNLVYTAWVSGANTITIQACNANAMVPQKSAGSGAIRVDDWKH